MVHYLLWNLSPESELRLRSHEWSPYATQYYESQTLGISLVH
jgi:hypothetical protein